MTGGDHCGDFSQCPHASDGQHVPAARGTSSRRSPRTNHRDQSRSSSSGVLPGQHGIGDTARDGTRAHSSTSSLGPTPYSTRPIRQKWRITPRQDGWAGRWQRRPNLRTLKGVLTMLDHTTNPNLRKTLRDLLLRAFRAIGSKIFRTDDRRARQRGWQIIPHHGGLSRTYRDPRFDNLSLCPICRGGGDNLCRTTCPGCCGSDSLVLGRVGATQPIRGHRQRGRP
jgi:hypothetical protein